MLADRGSSPRPLARLGPPLQPSASTTTLYLPNLLGFDDSRIAEMADEKVIGTTPANPTASRQAKNETLLSQGRIVRWEPDFEDR